MADELEYEFRIKPDANPELSHYVLEFHGTASRWDEELADEVVLATLRGHRIDLAAVRHDGLDVATLFESLYPDILEFEATIFHDDTCWLSEPDPQGRRRRCRCLVYLDELEVDPGWRNRGIGTRLMRRMSEMINLDDCLVGLKAFPLSRDYGRQRSVEEIQRLRRFYHKLGFVHAGKHFYEKDGNQCAAPKKSRQV